jgi:hypothetical protein
VSYNIPKTELKSFLFSIGSKKFGYGHYNRIKNLISILKIKRGKFFIIHMGKIIKIKITS